jgi:MCM P-loop domain
MRVTKRQLHYLKPYFVGSPKPNGEVDMLCPLHEDNKRSASLNVLSGLFYCGAEDIGMNVEDLMRQRDRWHKPSPEAIRSNGHGTIRQIRQENITEGTISGWQAALMTRDDQIDYLVSHRGLNEETIERFQIGWDQARQVYTIPIRGFDGEIWNVRRYDPDPRDEDSKIRSVQGMRVTELFPVSILDQAQEVGHIIICEGEWDVMRTIQEGYPAITKTSGAKTWRMEWGKNFKGLKVYLCHDRDYDGQAADRKIGRALSSIAEEVRRIELPYDVTAKHGKDLSDFWNEHDRADMEQLLHASRAPDKKGSDTDPDAITVLESFDSKRVGDPVKIAVTIKAKKEQGYSIPAKVRLACTQDRGIQCNYCPLKAAGGNTQVEIAPANPAVLGMIDTARSSIVQAIAYNYGVPGGKCPKLDVTVEEHQAVEIIYGRPAIDYGHLQKAGADASKYRNIRITSVGRHDTLPSDTVVATGALHPHPSSQVNEFLAWSVEHSETDIDRFELSPQAISLMKRFQPRPRQRPLAKLSQINRELSAHVTRIVGRPEMHALMDLTFHSILAWKFDGKVEERGWIQSIVIGDTGCGKSQVAQHYVRHFGGGEWVGGETASLAGLVGGLQQIGGKEWAVTWGVLPLNDKRLVVIDEFPHPEDIAKMSDTLSSGVAHLSKIQQDMTLARTRTIWMGNPPSSTMSNFTYGVDAFRAIINTPEDIRRFDLAMAVKTSDVDSGEINKMTEVGDLKYTAEACHTMLMWCWTRKMEDVIWARGAEETVLKLAKDMGSRYVEDPPLIQASDVRIKIARVAVALAARTFSTDDTHEKVVVTKEHVEDAVKFMDHIYSMQAFGYAERSRLRISDIQEAKGNRDRIRKYLHDRRQLARFLLTQSKFRRQDLEEVLNFDREQANAIISTLYNARMVRKQGTADLFVEPVLHDILREEKW